MNKDSKDRLSKWIKSITEVNAILRRYHVNVGNDIVEGALILEIVQLIHPDLQNDQIDNLIDHV